MKEKLENNGFLEDFGGEETIKEGPFYTNVSVSKVKNKIKETKQEEQKFGFCQWQTSISRNEFIPAIQTSPYIDPGIYDIYIDDRGLCHFTKKHLFSDAYINFPDSKLSEVINDVNSFWTLEDKFKKFGFVFKRGILLYGPAGSGKSVLLYQIMQNLVNQRGIVINTSRSPEAIIIAIKQLREIEPKKNIIIVLEDLDAYIRYNSEETVLSFLDGEDSINNTLTIATTNYPEKLDQRIVNRPRRFDRVIKIDMPTEKMREIYFKEKLNIEKEELKKYVDNTESFSFAALSELVISTKCFDIEFEKAIELLDDLRGKEKSSNEYYDKHAKAGFSS